MQETQDAEESWVVEERTTCTGPKRAVRNSSLTISSSMRNEWLHAQVY